MATSNSIQPILEFTFLSNFIIFSSNSSLFILFNKIADILIINPCKSLKFNNINPLLTRLDIGDMRLGSL